MTPETPPNGFRTFLIVWLTQSFSVFGSALTFFAISTWLPQVVYPAPEQQAQLSFALSAISLALALPMLLTAPVAGAWADRHDRKVTMLVADLANGLIALTLVGLMTMDHPNIWLLMLLVALSSICGSFHGAAFDTSYSMLVPEHLLPRANGMMQTMWSLSGILAPSLAAAIITLPGLARQGIIPGAIGDAIGRLSSGAPLAITIDALTFFVAALILAFLQIPSPKRADLNAAGKPRASIWADVKEGALYIWRRRPMLWLLGTFTLVNFTGTPGQIFMPLLTKFNLAADWGARGWTFETTLATLATVTSLGGLLGGILISSWGGLKRRRIYGIIIPMVIGSIAQIIWGFSTTVVVAAAMTFLYSFQIPLMNAHSQTIWQTQTPKELQGRVFSVRRVIAQCSAPLGMAVAGWLGGQFNPGTVMAVLGGVSALFCIAQLFNPVLVRVEDREWLDQMAARAAAEQG